MIVSPIIPLIGLGLILSNILVAIVRPYLPPTLMGIQLFLGGIVTLLTAVIDLINPLGIGEFERFFVFSAGCINCCVGYYMVLQQGEGGTSAERRLLSPFKLR